SRPLFDPTRSWRIESTDPEYMQPDGAGGLLPDAWTQDFFDTGASYLPSERQAAAGGGDAAEAADAVRLLRAKSPVRSGLGAHLPLPPELVGRLVTLLEGAPDSARAARIATALGTLASELVWRAPSRRNDPNREKIRGLAADALNRASSRFSQLQEIDRALRMIR